MSGAAAPLDEPAVPVSTARPAAWPLGAGTAGLVVFLWAVWVPALWLDEATTVVLIRRSWPELWAVGVQSDPALLPYYILVKPVLDLGGPMWTVRLVSVLAAAIAVAAVLLLGRRTLGPAVGVCAAAVVVVLPATTLFAQQARPQALAIAAVVLSIAAWWRAGPEDGGRRWWAAYALAVAAVALANLLALLVLLAPLAACSFLPHHRRRKVLGRTWQLTVGVLVVLSPYLYLVLTRAKGVATPDPVSLRAVWGLVGYPLGGGVAGALLLLVAVVSAVLLVAAPVTRVAGVLIAVWAFAPSLVLVLLAMAGRPVLVPRYAVVCLPALAILIAAAVVRAALALATCARSDRLARAVVGVGLVTALAVVVLPQSLAVRAPAGHEGEDLRPTLAVLQAESDVLPVVITHRISILTVQAYAPGLVDERMPQVADPSPLGKIAPERRRVAEVNADLNVADKVLVLVRVLRDASTTVPVPDAVLPVGVRGRGCLPTVLAVSPGWAAERLDCPPRA